MKKIIVAVLLLASSFAYGQKDSITNDTPLLSINDLQKVITSLESVLLVKDHKQVVAALQAVLVEAEKRRKKNF